MAAAPVSSCCLVEPWHHVHIISMSSSNCKHLKGIKISCQVSSSSWQDHSHNKTAAPTAILLSFWTFSPNSSTHYRLTQMAHMRHMGEWVRDCENKICRVKLWVEDFEFYLAAMLRASLCLRSCASPFLFGRYLSSWPEHTNLTMPALSPLMTEGNLTKWHLKRDKDLRLGCIGWDRDR